MTSANLPVAFLGWSHGGDTLASGSGGATGGSATGVLITRLWTKAGQPLAALSTTQYDSPYVLLWSPNGSTLVGAGAQDHKVRLWTTTRAVIPTIPTANFRIYDGAIAWSADSKTLAILLADTTKASVQLWGGDGKQIGTLALPSKHAVGIGWSPDSKLLTIAGDITEKPATSYLIDMTGKIAATLAGVAWPVAWSLDSTTLATNTAKGVQVWSSTGTALTRISVSAAKRLCWAPTGTTLAIDIPSPNAQPDTFQIYTRNGAQLGILDDVSSVNACAWSPDSRFFAAPSNGFPGSLRLWDSTTKAGQTFAGASSYLAMLAWSPDGRYIAAASSDKTGRVWSTDSKLVATLDHASKVYSVAWSPTGVLATGASGEVDLWK